MKLKHLILLMSSSIAASSIVSCTDEPYVISAKEEYTRNFIKTFGLIDPNQDWTAATRGNITVVTSDPTTVRIIADVDGKTYLFGQYADIQGEKTLNFDIPKNAKNVVAIANGKHYPVENGARLNLSSSRTVNSGSHGSTPTVTITRLYGDHSFLTIDMEEMTSFDDKKDENGKKIPGTGKLPESDSGGNTSVEKTNWDADGVTKDFHAEAEEFYLFPEYWNTGSWQNNTFGIYFEITEAEYDENDSSHEEVVVIEHETDAGGEDKGTPKSYYVKKVPIFIGQITELKGVKMLDDASSVEDVKGFYDIPEQFKTMVAQGLCAAYPDTYYQENPPYGGYIFIKEDGSKGYLQYEALPVYVLKDIAEVYPDLFTWSVDKGILSFYGQTYEEPVSDQDVGKTEGMYDFYRSYGVKVKLSERSKFGFYIDQNSNGSVYKMYSDAKLNAQIHIKDLDHKEKWMNCCYGATYLDGKDSEGNDKRYLLFEDWYTDVSTTSNFDMNDLMFRAYGFDNYRPGIDAPTGSIGDDSKVDDTTETYPLYPWIIACEDLGVTDDYDFNDVVFGVEHISGTQDVFVTALAAGGTLKAHLYYTTDNGKVEITGSGDNQSIVEKGSSSGSSFSEWHQWFGVNDHTRMLNTTDYSYTGATVRITLSKEDADKFSLSNEKKSAGWAQQSISHLGGFFIMVEQESGETLEIMAPYRSEDDHTNIPQMFQTTYKYQWPKERVSIYNSHAGNGEEIGKTPTGQSYHKNSFMHWVNVGDDADFHNTAPSSPNSTIKHGWTGDVVITKTTTTTTITDEEGNVTTEKVEKWTGEAYGNKYTFDSDPR